MDAGLLATIAVYIALSVVCAAVGAVATKMFLLRFTDRAHPFSSLKWSVTFLTNIIMTNGLTIGVAAVSGMYGVETSHFTVCGVRLCVCQYSVCALRHAIHSNVLSLMQWGPLLAGVFRSSVIAVCCITGTNSPRANVRCYQCRSCRA